MHIPFFNLQRQYASLKTEIEEAIRNVFSDSLFIGGSAVVKFEKEFASAFSLPHCIGTGNGTDALFIILKSLNLPAGAEVIAPAWGCIPSTEVASLAGFNLVFCDVHPEYYTLDPEQVVKKITTKTKAVIAVHLYGQAAAAGELRKICDAHKLYLIEDCAQAHLTRENNRLVGTFGVASAFSFYPTKNLGAYGDAGCILTENTELAERMRRFANHGALQKNDNEFEGTNSRLDTLQAAVLSTKLKYLSGWNERRKLIAEQYNHLLSGIPDLILPKVRVDTVHTFHIFCILTNQRDALRRYLSDQGIETTIHYPNGLPFTKPYRHLSHREKDFPVTARLQQQVLSIPIFPELTDNEVTFVSEKIQQYFSRAKG